MSHDLTRWIEAADERQFAEAVMFEHGGDAGEHHFLHLGDAIAHLPSWLRRSVPHEAPAAIGGDVIAFTRRPTERRAH